MGVTDKPRATHRLKLIKGGKVILFYKENIIINYIPS
jgi:hypothetical protein